ncbi:MAG: hypothetical protein QM817_24525 [Archangium sp.]
MTAAAAKPEVSVAEHVKEHMGKNVVVAGLLERVPIAKGKGEFQGTALVLDDDTTIYVTYAEPPKGWESLIGSRVRVDGLLSPSIDDKSQSLLAPHLRNAGTPVKEERKLGTLFNKRVRLAGIARDAKGGAVLLINNNEPIYVGGLDGWPDAADKKLVAVGGTLVNKQYLPEATRNAKGEISQGAQGKQTVLENPVWRVISGGETKP